MRTAQRVFVFAALLFACADDDVEQTTGPTTTSTTVQNSATSSSLSDEGPSTSTLASTTAATTTTTPPSIAGLPEARVGEVVPTELPVTSYPLPPGAFIEQVATGDEGILVALFDRPSDGHLLWAPEEPRAAATRLADRFPDQSFAPVVTALIHHGDRFLAFVMGDENADDRRPTVLTSVDGLAWELDALDILSPVRFALAAATPEAPPYPGPSGVTDAVAWDRGVVATGVRCPATYWVRGHAAGLRQTTGCQRQHHLDLSWPDSGEIKVGYHQRHGPIRDRKRDCELIVFRPRTRESNKG